MNIVFLGKFGRDAVGPAIAAVPGAVLRYADDVEQHAAVVEQAEGVVLVGPAYTAAVAAALAGANKLRWIQTLSAGYENLQRFGVPPGVTVTNAGDAWSVSVAEHAMALLLALAKRLPEAVMQKERRSWDRQLMACMGSLQGRTMVVIGFGSIGKAIAHRARAFGMKVVAVMRTPKPSELADHVYESSELHSALRLADVAVIAVPAHPDTVNLINEQTLRECRRGCLIINVARGEVIDPDALVDALRSGHIGGAGLDVTVPEPLSEASALWRAPNLIITPHVAGGGELVMAKLAKLVTDNVSRQLSGQSLHCVVIPPQPAHQGRPVDA
ncbi:putative D-isomer specific 2-hydroxyacid dehydrogenase NAD-binding protein [Paraburkholderia ribeironis]|uniref:Putative D-isomer specific 2-hydroxyacid dehydrogenase NAD-binding protein n=1 Tax=Paraburkholderia ribeironis TaxID=1247936 RepID=A0A1N7SM20_9BURK|nr:D-2-hydroxyacid dehydrogenase [Paraburkholderia ribeironis]SIT48449.1 putative D-isomer specific 2-hydroxyacid dehydrogenase NAD-binding protein [Paraburkholderia ribeironis]